MAARSAAWFRPRKDKRTEQRVPGAGQSSSEESGGWGAP
jgi:hypothetical protein